MSAVSTLALGQEEDEISTSRVSTGSSWGDFKRNLGFGYFNFASIRSDDLNRGYGVLESYNYLSIEYRLNRDEKVFYRPAFLLNAAGADSRGRIVPGSAEWSDGYFGYVSYSLPWLPFAMDYKTEVRVYIPTSEISQKQGLISRIRGDLKAYVPTTGRSSLFIWFIPDYFIQSRTASVGAQGTARGNNNFGYQFSANYFYDVTRTFGFGAAVGHEQYWSHASSAEGLDVFRREGINLSAFFGIKYRGLLTHLGFDQMRDVARPRDGFVLARDTETQYFARTYYRF